MAVESDHSTGIQDVPSTEMKCTPTGKTMGEKDSIFSVNAEMVKARVVSTQWKVKGHHAVANRCAPTRQLLIIVARIPAEQMRHARVALPESSPLGENMALAEKK